ncbi:hypothetical protein ACFXAZ_02880 [Streptomyces sp. NPDC059477]|uniref:hypothetical protein n=1 Tax=Streptomyces sp. NPDC059477 TaxID=3346847 RepID=UPI00368AD0EA
MSGATDTAGAAGMAGAEHAAGLTGLLARRRPRLLVAVGLLVTAVVVALLPLPPAGSAAVAAETSSAVTKSGTKGKYDDFSDLKVTVDQTEGLRSQGVRVSWEGGEPTQSISSFGFDYLQIMQCWGDEADGPSREQCVYGSGAAPLGGWTSTRSVASTGPTGDPAETQYTGGSNFVPFRPANGEDPTKKADDYTYYGPLDTNEQPANRTFANGTGEAVFAVQDGVEADYLGCGVNTAPEGSTPTPRKCWLVVVPRGNHQPDGAEITGQGTLVTSPLSATNWAQRIVFPLDFLQVDQFCPAGQAERPMIGSELVTDAVTSWQPELCTSTDSTFGFTTAAEGLAREQVQGTTAELPTLGFTVDPVPQAEGGPAVVHAPVAVSALAFAFFVEGPNGAATEMKLTPRLVAKMLTHSYRNDVALMPAPEHIEGNPLDYTADPEFMELNPDFPDVAGSPMSLVVPIGNSDTSRVVWNWLQADQEAREFLAGEPDPSGMKVNPYFQELEIDKNTALNEYPKVDPTRGIAQGFGGELPYTIMDLAPYSADLHDGALRARRGNNNRTIQYAQADGISLARLVNDPPWPGNRAVMAIVDVASADRYGLPVASLRNADGTFVQPSVSTLLSAVDTMQPSAADPAVLAPDPSRAKGEAYPLTAVAYAAASVDQDAAAREAYAEFIRYAAGPGQTPGLSAGELPNGYAPLPADLRTQASAAADDLERGAVSDDPSGTPDPDDPGDPGSSGSGGTGADSVGGTGTDTGDGAAAAAGGAAGDGTTDDPSAAASAAAGESASPSSGPQQNVADAQGGFTPGEILGIIRWVLLVVLILGGSAALSGPVMLRLAHRRSP